MTAQLPVAQPEPGRAWRFWEEAAGCMTVMAEIMQHAAWSAALDVPMEIPRAEIQRMHVTVGMFQEKFALLAQEMAGGRKR